MQKNFTHLIIAVSRARNHRAVIATLLLFMLLLLAKSVSAQTVVNPTPAIQNLCEFIVGSPNSVTFSSSYTSGNGNNDRATTLYWEYSPTGAENTWSTVNSSGGIVNGITTPSFNGNLASTTLTLTNVPVSYSGQYRAVYIRVVTNGNNTTTTTLARTTPVTLTVNPLPIVAIEATSITNICSGGKATLIASGAPQNGTYKWYTTPTGGTAIYTGATYSPTLTSNASYYVESVNPSAQGACVSATRARVDVTINSAPLAQTVQVCSGNPITLKANLPASQSVTPTAFNWYSAASAVNPLSTTNINEYTTGNITSNTDFYVSAVYPVGSGTCETNRTKITVTANQSPVITDQPVASSTCVGQPASFTIKATGSGLTAQWYKVGEINPISSGISTSTTNGVTTSTLTLTNVQLSDNNAQFYAVVSGTCSPSVESNKGTLTVKPLPDVPTITNLTANQNVYTGGSAITLIGSPAGGTFLGTGVTTTNGVATFNPCTAGTGPVDISYTVTNGSCTNKTTVRVNVVTTTYTVINSANPFPICKGSNTIYTATVYRDIIVYDVTDSRHTQHGEYLAAPQFKKTEFIRYWQPEFIPKPNAAPTTTDLIIGLGKEETMFSYKWFRNSNNVGPDRRQTKQAGLSSTDEYYVRVTLKSGSLVCGGNINNLESNHLKISTPQDYNMILSVAPSPICSNEPITLTAKPDLGNINFGNLQIAFYIKKVASPDTVLLHSSAILTPPFTTYSHTVLAGVIENGDIISVAWSTDEIKCFSKGTAESQITMVVNTPPAITATGQPKSTAACQNNGATFSVSATGSGLSFRWYKVGETNPISLGNSATTNGVTTNTLTLTNVQAIDNNSEYYVIVSGTCSPSKQSENARLTVNPLPTTQIITAPSYCASTSTGSAITITTQAGVTYSLKQGNNILATLEGNGTSLNFSGTYAKGTYSVEGVTTTTPSCTAIVGSVTISETSSIDNVIAELIVSPDPLQYFQEATFTANPKEKVRPDGTTITWKYQWYIDYFDNSSRKLEITTNNELSLTAEQMNMSFFRVRVVQLAPENDPTCYSSLASEEINTDRNVVQPVELLYLKADKKDNNVVAVEWATAMEKNSEGFEIQVSQDAKNYRSLAFVASKAGGNTNQKQVYTFHDKENGKYGTRYYRLMQRDMNGDSEYFGPKAVKIGDAVESLSAYPNPFSSEVSLEFNAEEAGTMQVLVTDAAGAKILERTLPAAKGNNRTLLQLNSRLPQGMYIITTRLNGKTNHIKLLKK